MHTVYTSKRVVRAAVRAAGTLRRLLLLSALVFLLSALPAAALGDITPFCTFGSGPGKCNGPQGVAVDPELEPGPPAVARVYVADSGNNRVNVFGVKGEFVSSFGAGTDPTWVAVDNDAASGSRHDLYVSNTSGLLVRKFKPSLTGYEEVASESFGEVGTGPCQFSANDPLAVGPNGDVYVADSYEKGGKVFVSRVIVFDSSGGCLKEIPLFEGTNQTIRNFAVDASGHMYVTVAGAGGVISKYGPTGALEFELNNGPEDNGTEAEGLAVDDSGDLFAKQREASAPSLSFLYIFFTEFSPTGVKLKRFGYVEKGSFSAPALAAYHSPEGDLFASEGSEGIKYLQIPSGPVVAPEPCKVQSGGLGNTQATLEARVNPEGKTTSVKFEYMTQAQFEAEGGFHNAQGGSPVSVSAASEPFDLHDVSVKVEGLVPETKYRCRVVAENSESVTPTVGEEGVFLTREGFEFGPDWSVNVGETVATIFAGGDPLEIPATGQIEYVEDAKYQQSKFAEAQSAPTPELEFGSGSLMVFEHVTLTGLKPGTLYHYRLRARNGAPPEGIVCPERKTECPAQEHTFKTYLPEAGVPDGRGDELVSPGLKNSAEVAVPGNKAGVIGTRSVRIQAAAGPGDAVTYTSWTSFGAAEGAPATSQYLSKRTGSGWVTENISPFGFLADPLFAPFSGFTPDLRFAAFKTTEPRLTPDCRKSEDMYLRDNQSGQLLCLSPEVSQGPEAPCLVYGGASEDGSRVFLAGMPEGGKVFTYSLYERTSNGVNLVSVLPGGEAAPASKGTAFGPGGSSGVGGGEEGCKVTGSRLRHAISNDGAKAFWTYVPEESKHERSQLLVRVNGSETLQLDKHQSGAGTGSGNGVFWTASAEGSVAYFTDTERLVAGANPATGAPDLYRYELGTESPLSDLTKGTVPGGVQGVVGASDDGSYVYFVAQAVLGGGEEENATGQKAQAGKDNLYLYHEGVPTFIATLSSKDGGDWSANPRELTARISPDGKHLAFLSVEAPELVGYDNMIAEGEHCQYDLGVEGNATLADAPRCLQAFLYDVGTGSGPGRLSCVSCNPSGSRPLGPTIVPGWTNGFEGPRFLSDNGSRFFFESFDSLLPGDVNGELDVYEFERPGEGSCNETNPNYDTVSDGCHFLVSTGRSSAESFLIDASSDGSDVFFSTRQSVVGWDVNDNYDVYDRRVDGGFAEPATPAAPCADETGCLSSAMTPPSLLASSTPGFNGPGNPTPTTLSKPAANKHAKQKKHVAKKKHVKKKPVKKKHKKNGRNQASKGRARR
jgi:hypothetical protein